ncbi:MAG: hypothetical protein ACD_48C00237G0003 [uncultured bacterium]|nr:MAG: hypothetical protein ACD_48C00237G0003 [uncultured bacterium]
MKLLQRYFPFILFLFIIGVLFHKTFVFGKIPFPGDLMLSEYAPFRHTEYFGYAAGGIPSKGQYFDVARELYPWKTLVIDALKNKTLPLWNPYNFSGTPLLANYQSQTLYPLGILYLLLPQPIAWTIMVMLQLVLGMAFMYLFSYEIGLSKSASVITAITFNLSSFAVSWIEFNTVWHTILWLPLLLYLVERGISQKRLTLWKQVLFIFSLFSAITAGHPQDFLNTFFFLIVYIIVRLVTLKTWTNKEKFSYIVYHLSCIILIPFFLAAIQLLPTVELFTLSSRIPHDVSHILSTMLVQIWQLPLLIYQDFFGNPATKTYVIPDTYVGKTLSIGITGFTLALWSFFAKKKSWQWKFFAITSAVMLIISINSPLTAFLYRFPIPILSTGTPTRNLFVLMFALSILAGIGFDSIEKNKNQTKLFILSAVAIVAIAWISALVLPTIQPIILPSLLKRSALIVSGFVFVAVFLLMASRYKSILLNCFIILIVVELGYGFIKFNPFVPASFLYPANSVFEFLTKNAGYYRFWGYGTARIESNLNAQYKLFSADGTDPLNIKWYNQFIQASGDGYIARTFTRSTRSDAAITPGYGARDLPDNPYRLRIMDLLGVKYILDRPENPKDNTTFEAKRFKPITTLANGYTIFENKLVYPRAFLASEYKTYDSIESFEQQFFAATFDPRQTILLPNDTPSIDISTATQAETTILSYKPEEVIIKTSSDAPQILFLSDAFAPGWIATIDGTLTSVYRANYAFRAVSVPTGTHIVSFTYQPISYTIGAYLTLFGICSMCLFLLFPYIKKHT